MSVCCCNYFIYYEKTNKLLFITFVAGIISCVIYFAFIPVVGIYAALLGFYIGCLYQGYSGYHYKLYKTFTLYKLRWWKFLIAQLLMTFIVFFSVDLNISWKLLLSMIFVTGSICVFLLKTEMLKEKLLFYN